MNKLDQEKHIASYQNLLRHLGEDPSRNGLLKTPNRVLKSLEYLTSGYDESAETVLTSALFDVDHQDMVIVRDIELYSLCEHHMLPFFGRCHIAYIPDKKIVGLSKLPRVVDVFSKRLQVQERLTHQVANAIFEHLQPLGVGVVVEASHLCMMMRGVAKQNSFTMTSSMLGCFQEAATRNEFLSLLRGPKL